MGSTDDNGQLVLPLKRIPTKGMWKVIKHGFSPYQFEMSDRNYPKVVSLKQSLAFLRVDSQPQGADVYLDQMLVGKTPLSTPLEVPSGFVKLELKGIGGYKTFQQVLDLDEGALELVGERGVKLEMDYLAKASRLVQANKKDEALAIYESVPKEHSDYLSAMHQAGEIYLTSKNEPAKAAKLFGEVTENPSVKNFQDKRFIGSHINEGLALYMTGEGLLKKSPELAKEHLIKSIEVLTNVEPYLSYMTSAQITMAKQNLRYHRALANHNLWQITKERSYLVKASDDWQIFLSEGHGDSFKQYREFAQVYLKQAESILHAENTEKSETDESPSKL